MPKPIFNIDIYNMYLIVFYLLGFYDKPLLDTVEYIQSVEKQCDDPRHHRYFLVWCEKAFLEMNI